jgi:hypothetical protein
LIGFDVSFVFLLLAFIHASDSTSMTPKELEKGSVEDSSLPQTEIVDWDGEDDPTNPRNWPKSKRWAHVVIISILALIT